MSGLFFASQNGKARALFLRIAAALFFAVVMQVQCASAQVNTDFGGTLDGSQQYYRPFLSSTSGTIPVGGWTPQSSTLYNYFERSFTPSVTGNYSLQTLGSSTLSDPMLFVYGISFDPNAPLTNGIGANDDDGVGLQPLLSSVALTQGATYIIVATSYISSDTGQFDFRVSGPGGIQLLLVSPSTPVGPSTYVVVASPTSTKDFADYFDLNDDAGDRALAALVLDTLDEQDLVVALKTIFPSNSAVNSQALVGADSQATDLLLSKIGTVLGSAAPVRSLRLDQGSFDVGNWLFAHKTSWEERRASHSVSLASANYDLFTAGEQGLWAEAIFSDTDGDATSSSLGFDAFTQGVVIGYERAVSANLLLGLMGGVFTTDVDTENNASYTDADNYNAGVYGQYLIEGVKLSGVLLFGHGDYDTRRAISLGAVSATPRADYNNKSFSSTLSASKLFEHNRYKLEPFLTLSYFLAKTNGYTETGGGAFNMQVGEDSFSGIGLKTGFTVQNILEFENNSKLDLKLKPYVEHDFELEEAAMSVALVGDTNSTTINGRDLTVFGFGMGGK